MYRHALAAAFVLGMALVASPEAWGCSCAGVAPSSRAVRAVDVIFIGKVTAVTEPRWQSRTDADGSVSVSPTEEPSFAADRGRRG